MLALNHLFGRLHSVSLVTLLVVVALLASESTAFAIIEYPVPTPNSVPAAICAGPDGNVWFTEAAGNKIVRVTPSGVMTEFIIPTPNSDPEGITAGPDGALWFTEFGADKIGRITTDGVITEFQLPMGRAPAGITTGPDGNLWFTEAGGDRIGRMGTAGIMTLVEFLVPGMNSFPLEITTGPDGRLWFTQSGSDQIGAITTIGVIEEFQLPAGRNPQGITLGPDGNLWFTEFGGGRIGRIGPGGQATITEFIVPGIGSQPFGITAGPDGNLWFTQFGSSEIGKITTAGIISEFVIPTANSQPAGITSSGGFLWFTETAGNKIGRFNPADPNNDPPMISINDVALPEGNSGLTPFTFTVTLSNPTMQTVTVQYQTANGTAFAPEDYLPASGTLTFMPGDVSETITVFVQGDTFTAPDETFFVNLSNPTNGTISDGQGLGTILADKSGTGGAEQLPPTAFALTNNNQLLSFNVAQPGVILSSAPITGLISGEAVIGIDFRPANGLLYGFTNYSRLVTINTTTGAATAIANVGGSLVGNEYGMDFNPTNDRIRLVNDFDQNVSVNPDDGTATVQTALNPGNPTVTAVAYSNNVAGALTTTLYDIDANTDTLLVQNPPANGTLSLVGPLGVDTGQLVGFDIAPTSGIAYATLTRPLDNAASLYVINLSTGQATLVGQIGDEATVVRDLSIGNVPSPTIVGVTTSGKLVTFNALTPGTISAAMTVTGLISGEVIIAIDFRPAGGALFGYTNYGRLVTINPTTAVAAPVGIPPGLGGNEYGFDFNPVPDRIRIVNDTDQNARVNPNDGTLTMLDTPLAYAAGDPNFGQNPNVTGVAYTNNFAGTTATTLYGIDYNLSILVRQGSPNGTPTSPNSGQLFTIGSLGFSPSQPIGFDIANGNGAAFAAMQPSVGGFSRLYAINLLSGRATLIGVIGVVEPIRGIAVAPAGTF